LAGEGVKQKLAKLTGVEVSVVSMAVADLLRRLEEREEARKLIEAGFEYVCTFEDVMLFRKRK